ncbi:MAG: hypothetical protein DIJKHBIC_04078 [Thermoanaerobaculia bacterium]|nr:hypothetical protein [Thermoanaerobaculia bacterium]
MKGGVAGSRGAGHADSMAFITKDDQARIDDAFNFIAGTTLVPARMKLAVSTFVSDFIKRKLPTGSSRQEIRNFSRGMSMAKVHHSGTEGQRALRRAIHLLWEAMENHERAEQAKLTPGIDLVYDFKRSMEKAWIVSEKKGGGLVAHKWVFDNGLKLYTKAFLRRNRLFIQGSSKIDGTQGDQNVLDFEFGFDELKDRYTIAPKGLGGYSFKAVSVPAVHWTDVPRRGVTEDSGSFGAMNGTEFDGASVMVTTQFTGCSFCLKDAGRLLGAHISPSVPGRPHPFSSGTKLAQQLSGVQEPAVGKGDFANGNPGTGQLLVYGRGYSNMTGLRDGYDPRIQGGGSSGMYIVGFKRPTGQWKVFSQEIVDNHIVKAIRIYPTKA